MIIVYHCIKSNDFCLHPAAPNFVQDIETGEENPTCHRKTTGCPLTQKTCFTPRIQRLPG
ncbi:hypothetical protein NITGR_800022 [Nitrospina gracilis 3/211]|uniref:Uncharacterized protein n=1 Tax=Nitrospina gracilis (strain 3/211) TaxID=1266370 RepID=M1Z1B7_NITG3|nr:hypothetical protein NITGR_800022 [Nitrospina gracilis 3/211]